MERKEFRFHRFHALQMSEKNVHSLCERIASQCLEAGTRSFTELFGTICHRTSRTRPERQPRRLRLDSSNLP